MVGLLEKRFNQAKETFQESEEFTNILTAHIDELTAKKKDAFKHILDIVNVLKSHVSDEFNTKKKKSKHQDRTSQLKTKKTGKKFVITSGSDTDRSKVNYSKDGTSGSERDSTAHESDAYTRLKEEHRKEALNIRSESELSCKETSGVEPDVVVNPSTSEKDKTDGDLTDSPCAANSPAPSKTKEEDLPKQSDSCSNRNVNNSGPSQRHEELPSVTKPQKRKKKVTNRQVRKYERLLHKLSLEIKRLSEKELTLEEMDQDDSTHILEYQLRKRATKVYEKLCELKEVQPKTGRVSERRIKFQGTRFPEINKKLEKLANLPEYFPDFQDVFIIITKVNDRKELRLDRRKIHNMAKDAFEMIGKKLQQRRQEDFLANFSSHPTLDFVEARDPADLDLELQMKLKTNYKLGNQNLNQVTQSYEKKQETNEQMGVNMEVPSGHSESEPESDEDAAPKKKKRRISLINVVEDEEDEDDREIQDITEDETGDEGTGQSALEADDEEEPEESAWFDKESDDDDEDEGELERGDGDNDEDEGEHEDDDNDDDGAEDFGPLSPLPVDDDNEPITDDNDDDNSIEEVVLSPEKQPETVHSGGDNAANTSISTDATSFNISSSSAAAADKSSASDTNNSSRNNSVRRITPQIVSLKNGTSREHNHTCPGKSLHPVELKQADILNGNHAKDHGGEGDSLATSLKHSVSSTSASSAVQVVDSSTSLPINRNVKSLRHESGKETDDVPVSAASDPGRVSPVPSPGSAIAVHELSGMLAKEI